MLRVGPEHGLREHLRGEIFHWGLLAQVCTRSVLGTGKGGRVCASQCVWPCVQAEVKVTMIMLIALAVGPVVSWSVRCIDIACPYCYGCPEEDATASEMYGERFVIS